MRASLAAFVLVLGTVACQTNKPDLQPSDAAIDSPEDRTVLAGHVENARTLEGLALTSGAKVAAATLFRGPPLANLTDEACADIASLGLRTIIDLRVESEITLKPDAPCALERAQLVAAALPVPYNVSVADYIADLDASESIVKVFEVLGDPARYPVYFHCTWGRDRTGVLAAVILLALGADSATIMQDYLVSQDSVGAYPASLEGALAEIEARGGVEAYLAAAGVSPKQLEALRTRAIERAR